MFKQTILAAAAVAAMTTGALAQTPFANVDITPGNGRHVSDAVNAHPTLGPACGGAWIVGGTLSDTAQQVGCFAIVNELTGVTDTYADETQLPADAALGDVFVTSSDAYEAYVIVVTGSYTPSNNGLNAQGGFLDGEDAAGRQNRLHMELDNFNIDLDRLLVIEEYGTPSAQARARTIRLVRECERPGTTLERKQVIADHSRPFGPNNDHIAGRFVSLSNDQANAIESACGTTAGRPAHWAPIIN